MKILKRIAFIIVGLFGALCVFVLICAFNPAITQRLTQLVSNLGWDDAGEDEPGGSGTAPGGTENLGNPEDGSGSGSGNGENPGGNGGGQGGGSGAPTVKQDIPPVIEDGYSEAGVRNPYGESARYQTPASEVRAPQKVAGKTGYVPVAEAAGGAGGGAQTEEPDYGYTGENLNFDTAYYPYYGMLSQALQRVYRQVYANAQALKQDFTPLESLTPQQMQNVMEAVYNDHPELFWMETAYACTYGANGGCTALSLQFNQTAGRLSESGRDFTAAANEIIAGAINYTTDFEKERYVHDALLGRVEYQTGAKMSQSAYSALVNRRTVCAGYARAFQYIMQQLNIPCYYCTGYSGENHAWNIVLLDGDYYNVDLTWDDTQPGTYDYFNRSDAEFAGDHVRKSLSVYLPACGGTKYQKETAGRTPNTWQSGTGNATDNSGGSSGGISKPVDPPSIISPGNVLTYKGETLTKLQDYYDNCYRQLAVGSRGATVRFQNVVDQKTLDAIYAASDADQYKKGYLDKMIKDMKVDTILYDIVVTKLEDGKYMLDHTYEIY